MWSLCIKYETFIQVKASEFCEEYSLSPSNTLKWVDISISILSLLNIHGNEVMKF